jgi:hypothetical protein
MIADYTMRELDETDRSQVAFDIDLYLTDYLRASVICPKW